MTMKVKRYEPCLKYKGNTPKAMMTEHSEGRWVKLEEIEKLMKKILEIACFGIEEYKK